MQLWTDYEGLTIDGAFTLKRLLLPEGRSAFFSTANGKGEPLVLRLIECHFDQEEILARWRCLEALDHPAMLKLEHYGPIELDGGPAVYAVFEKVDTNLSEALDHGHLSVKETVQIAACLFSALQMLHDHGFVHEHMEARNIFAVGDAVKLRSDCIREAREGEEGRAAKQCDVRDAATVLLQALTQHTTLDSVRETEIPAPLGEIIRNGISGVWGLAEMRAALEGRKGGGARTVPAPAAPAASGPAVHTGPRIAATEPPATRQLNLKFPLREREKSTWEDNPVRSAMRQQVFERVRANASVLRSRWIAPVAAVVMLVLAGILFTHAWHTRNGASRPVKAAARRVADQPVPRHMTMVAHPIKSARPGIKHGRTQWRVILYTYDHQDAAQKMAARMAGRHPGLRPEVFTPSGHAPYLVTIGGIMSREQASAMVHRARAMGLPHDAYAQNY